MKDKKVDCFNCEHFYVTWDRQFPRGCRAFGFKTKHLPSSEVLQASGKQCLHFTKKRP